MAIGSECFFQNPLDANTSNFVKDLFIISKENINKKITLGHEKVLALQKPVWILKKYQGY